MANRTLWLEVLKRLKPTIKKANFITWFQNTTVMDDSNGTLTIGVPTAFAQNWISSKYELKVLQAAQESNKSLTKVNYEVHSSLADNNEGVDIKDLYKAEVKKVRKMPKKNVVKVSRGGVTQQSVMLNARYNLDNFVIGKDNRLPHAAATAVVNMPGGIYNPLYVYGRVGVGKTHLVQGIGNAILRQHPDLVVKYMTAEKFVSEVVNAIGKRHMDKFKAQYRNVDVFIMDDVQFFARKDSSQQEFFHTFNELYDGNKQIILTSDRAPSELDDLDERLKSRFGMGMVVELLVPDFETKLAILHQKCADYQAIIDPEVLSFIASNVHSSVRELEGVLKQAIAEWQLQERVPTIRSVAEIIKRLNKAQEIIGFDIERKRTERMARTSEDVMQIVAEYFDLTTGDLTGKNRKKEIMGPRQICMYLIKSELGASYEKIGEGFGGRNHTTVMHACKKVADKLQKDVRLVRDINALKREMGL